MHVFYCVPHSSIVYMCGVHMCVHKLEANVGGHLQLHATSSLETRSFTEPGAHRLTGQ